MQLILKNRNFTMREHKKNKNTKTLKLLVSQKQDQLNSNMKDKKIN